MTEDKVREIKQSFRLLMNGVTAQSMREKGINYHINWGASLMHLKEMADEYEQDTELALALWKENVRECKILATMLMPCNELQKETALQWVRDTRTQEMAEIAAMNLYQYLPYAAEMAVTLIQDAEDMVRIQGYNILARLFNNGERRVEENITAAFMKNVCEALLSGNIAVKHSAWNAVVKYADMDEQCRAKAKNTLMKIKMDDWL